MTEPTFIKLTDEQVGARRRRNLAIAAGLVGFAVVVFIVTVTNLQRNSEAAKASAEAVAAAEARTQADARSVTVAPASSEPQS
ncbi:hypothetical protein [Brevundimonas vesicularis]|uniref:hypothetical protein n=1 Tax=Brevundimonas vesicularis TaxID=41276 RepID=UPI0038D46CB7